MVIAIQGRWYPLLRVQCQPWRRFESGIRLISNGTGSVGSIELTRPISAHQFGKHMRSILKLKIPPVVGIALSGGVDSMALAYLASRFFANYNTRIVAFTVDHGARPESASEASVTVKRNLGDLNIDHHVLTIKWPENKVPEEKFEEMARSERRKTLIEACEEHGIQHLLLAHTLDDQFETFIMRLCKGSSIYGLAGMREITYTSVLDKPDDCDEGVLPADRDSGHSGKGRGVHFVRPLLTHNKRELEQTCLTNNIQWVEDKTNHDPTFTVRNSIRTLFASPNNLPLALQPASLTKTLKILSKTRSEIEKEAEQTLEFMLRRKLISIDRKLGIAYLTEFEGFNKLRISVKTLLFMYIMRQISSLSNLDYKLASIDSFVRTVSSKPITRLENFYTCGLRVSVYPEKKKTKINTTSHIEKEQQVLFSESTGTSIPTDRKSAETTVPQRYTIWRERIRRAHQNKYIVMPLPEETLQWSEWLLFDNRFWIRIRATSTAPQRSVSIRLLYELSDIKKVLTGLLDLDKSYRWPFEATLASQPFFMYHDPDTPNELSPTSLIGFPTLGLYDAEKSGVEIECRLKTVSIIPGTELGLESQTNRV
ncbi:hypothetical protein AWJ20_4112 [Sugiyamaella lignohabitans]|uniref:tRNA(Ile)-lysidine synthetase n=1 Tax=Sugiyamaella lignohabitans TaxID=796027 RepID=A0A161HJ22_9ASCO|nr:uncharacterized protein AWJ20_4112 [Sugiyamaella lignohabitans]ANB11308.1 hypothetical protein AWJ20_4112 [Sugiyamaella lignohabitans]